MKKTQKRNCLICVIAIILFALCTFMFMRIDDRIVLHVDNFEITNNASSPVTIGNESDVCFNKIPHDFLEVFVEEDSIRWNVNERYWNTDSLCYYKVNNVNPNIHPLSPSDHITISTGSGIAEMSVAEISEMLKDVKNEYVMLRNIFGKKQIEFDTTFSAGHDFTQDRGIKSFIYRKKSKVLNKMGECHLVILDNRTKLHHDNEEIGYAMSGSSSKYGDKAKIQFFRMAPAAYRESKPEKEYFAIEDINYVTKPVVVTTQWGAGHILVKRNKDRDRVKCYFQKPITYVERIDELKNASAESSGMLTFHQEDNGFPSSSMLTTPKFSNQASTDICNLRFSNDSILCDGNTITSEKLRTPSLENREAGVNDEIGIHIGILNIRYLWSCLRMPLAILLLCVISYVLFLTLNKIREDVTKSKFLEPHGEHLPSYLTAVFLILFTYVTCRIMISVKLGHTYPYFDHIFGVNIASVCLLIMLVYGLSGLINIKFIVAERKKWSKFWPFMFPLFYLIGIVICCITFNKMSDAHFYSVLQSYLPGEVNNNILTANWKFWNWNDMTGMTDLFFNIPYTLLFVNIAALMVMCVLIIDHLFFNDTIVSTIQKPISRIRRQTKKWGLSMFWSMILLLAISCVPLLFLRFLPGNFATAIITFLIIVLMSSAFSKVQLGKEMSFLKAMCIYFSISIVFMAAAMWSGHDFGYITNAIGFIMFVFFVYIITEKLYEPQKTKEATSILLGFFLVCGIFWGGMYIWAKHSDPDLSRGHRRANMTVNWNSYANSGYRYAESDAEFTRVMKHYMFSNEFVSSDPLSNDSHILHPSISTGQAPVILNDVSLQSCFFGTYGKMTYLVYFALLTLLCLLVITNTIGDSGIIGRWVYWRALAMFMWIGTSLYLFLSYMGILPFTGRLNPGFGVDSVGEALETSILMAFMLSTAPYKENSEAI